MPEMMHSGRRPKQPFLPIVRPSTHVLHLTQNLTKKTRVIQSLKITSHRVWNSQKNASFQHCNFRGQKLIKNAKNGPFWRVFGYIKLVVKTVLPDKSILIWQKLMENVKMSKIQKRHFGWFSNTVFHICPFLTFLLKNPSTKYFFNYVSICFILGLKCFENN